MICIYAIINIIDDKCYVGQASDKNYRWREHRKSLRGFYHHSLFLQRAWCKHGENNFIFVVLEVLNDTSKLNEREIYWGNLLKPEYNVAPLGGSMKGYKHTEEAKANMRKAHIGKPHHSEEEKRKRSERMKGNQWNKGRKQTPEELIIRRNANLGKKRSPETLAKMSAALKGRIISEETKRKMSEAAKRRWQTS